jgi:periplasmic protein TonB
MRRSSTIVSIVVHAIVVAAAFMTQLLAVGPLPAVPHEPMSFVGVIPIRVIDIPLPPPQRAARSDASVDPTGPAVAPIEAPAGVAHEAVATCTDCTTTDAIGVERGIGSSEIFGRAEPVPAAPPPPPAPQTPIHLRSGMRAPRKVQHVDPVYPRIAQASHVEGTVVLEAVIDVNGAVTSVRVLRSIPLLDQAAVDAVRAWKFTPTLLNGVPVPVALTVTVRFALTDR